MSSIRHISQADPPALTAFGPLVQVTLVPPPAHRAALTAAGQPVPTQPIKMMIDTGAQKTVVNGAVAAAVGLPPVRFTAMVGVSQKPEQCPVYLVTIVIGMRDHSDPGGSVCNAEFNAEVIGGPAAPFAQAHAGLLGRDFLEHFELVYNGPAGRCDLVFPRDRAIAAGLLKSVPPKGGHKKRR